VPLLKTFIRNACFVNLSKPAGAFRGRFPGLFEPPSDPIDEKVGPFGRKGRTFWTKGSEPLGQRVGPFQHPFQTIDNETLTEGHSLAPKAASRRAAARVGGLQIFYFFNTSSSLSRALSASPVSLSRATNLLPIIAPAALLCALSRVWRFDIPKPIMRGFFRLIELMWLK